MKKRMLLFAVLSLFLVAVTGCKDDTTPPEEPPIETDTLERIELSGGIRKFVVGTDFSVGDLVVKAIYSQSGEKTLTGSEYKVDSSKVDKNKPGTYEIVVSYKEQSAKYTVTYEPAQSSIVHQNAFVVAKPEGAVIRPFNANFDVTINDFSSETLVGSTSNGVYDSASTLRVLVDNEAEGFPNTTDASIYKMATGTYDLATASNIGFKLRVVSGTIDYSNLILALRGDDSYNVFEISLADAVNDDGEELPKLSDEYQDICISPNLSIEDADTEYTLASSGEKSGVKVLSKILGFHLYAKEECSAILEIKEVFFTIAGEKTTLDKFDREAVNKTDDTCWWRDSTGFIVLPNITLNAGATYTTPTISAGEETQLVVSVLGDTNGLSITPVVNGTAKTAIPWASLKNKDGEALSHAVNGAFYPYAIDLEKSGLLEEGLDGFVFTSTTECSIANVFYSSLKEKEALQEYPHIDTENVVIFDNFNRTQATIDPSYETSILNEKVLAAGLNYFICYKGSEAVSVNGDALVFEPQADYTQIAIGSTRGRTNQKYMVIVAKVEDGDLNNFRLSGFGGDTVYANQWLAGEGLKSIPESLEEYPYQTKDGFVWYVIDLEASNMPVKDQLDLYYTGTGTLTIDSIFFAEESFVANWTDVRTEEQEISLNGGYTYAYGGANTTGTKFCMEVKGDGTATFQSFRFALASQPALWLKDTLKAYYEDGTLVLGADVIPTENTKIYIDFVENGFTVEAGDIHLHWDMEGAEGVVTLVKTSVLVPAKYSVTIAEDIELNITNDAAYQYVGNNTLGLSMLKFVVKGDGAVTLESLRLQVEGQGDYIWANNGLVLLNEDGTAYNYAEAVSAEGVTFYVDLAASGLEEFANHIHMFVGGSGVGNLTIEAVEGVSDTVPYSVLMEAFSEELPAPVTPEE